MNSKAHQPQLYQVDFCKKKAGKQFSKSKRRVTWKFGFANEEAIKNGANGVECRGVEHEVCLIWSVNSGKRLVTFDGRDVHYSVAPRETKFECTWQMKDGPFMKIVGNAVAPVKGKPEGWRMFDLFLNGLSFFDFTKMYELGPAKRGYITPSSATKPENEGVVYAPQEYNLRQKDVGCGKSIQNIPTVSNNVLENAVNVAPQCDLLDFTMEPTPTSSSPSDIFSDNHQYETNPFPTNNTQIDPFAPGYVSSAPTKSYNDFSNDIMNAYQETNAPLAIEYPTAVNEDADSKYEKYGSLGVPSLQESSTSSTCSSEEQESWEKHTAGFEDTLKKLVNFDDISSAPESFQPVLTMKPMQKVNKSSPLPPASHTWCGAQPSLSEIKAVKHNSLIKNESVMNAPPAHIAQQPGAMVLYGSQPEGSLPPPAVGFGAGAHMGYNQGNNASFSGYNQSYRRY